LPWRALQAAASARFALLILAAPIVLLLAIRLVARMQSAPQSVSFAQHSKGRARPHHEHRKASSMKQFAGEIRHFRQWPRWI
jgi:hypothetical protein